MRCEERNAFWWLPEALRIKGEVLAHIGDAANAAADFERSLETARRQKALSWELRTGTSIARSLHAAGRSGDAAAVLGEVYGRFTEGFGTSDLKAARALLAMLQKSDRRRRQR